MIVISTDNSIFNFKSHVLCNIFFCNKTFFPLIIVTLIIIINNNKTISYYFN